MPALKEPQQRLGKKVRHHPTGKFNPALEKVQPGVPGKFIAERRQAAVPAARRSAAQDSEKFGLPVVARGAGPPTPSEVGARGRRPTQ
jgi:hypothetical protein